MTYLMESEREGERLKRQEEANPSAERLRATGLVAGMRALDAGCGAGAVTEVMGRLVGTGSVLGLDRSGERVEEARRTRARENVEYRVGDVTATGLADASFDYVWSQYVFEYLPRPQAGLAELIRVVKPGGRIVVADVDGAGLANHPFPSELEAQFRKVQDTLAKAGLDLFVGRKLFHLFKQAGLEDVRVHVHPMYVAAGPADERLVTDWEQRFAAIAAAAAPALGGEAAYQQFAGDYLQLLRSADTLKYSLVLVTEGRKP